MRTYLPDDLLIKTDRSSMAASLETRAPLLDHWLVEMAATIPLNLKLNGSTTKYILKQIARDLLPAEIIQRQKHGFGVPLGAWLRKDASPGARDAAQPRSARARLVRDGSRRAADRRACQRQARSRSALVELAYARMVVSSVYRPCHCSAPMTL